MKNYTFRIKASKEDERHRILKKQFTLKLKNNIDLYDMFEHAIQYVEDNWKKFFEFGDLKFRIVRGKEEIRVNASAHECMRCGRLMDFYWENNY